MPLSTAPEALPPFRSQIRSLLLLAGVFFMSFLSRIVLAPLLMVVEADLGLDHADAASLFVLISLGVCFGLLSSGFISSRFTHRSVILGSGVGTGVMLLAVAAARQPIGMGACLVLLGYAAGVYFPSGVAAVTALTRQEHWGKAISIHELAPNLAFVAAPFLAELLWPTLSWRGILAMLGLASLAMVLIFARLSQGARFTGQRPHFEVLQSLLSQGSFWLMVALFCLAVAVSLGVFTIVPLYLVAERGMESSVANSMVGYTRIPGVCMALISGWLVDRIGVKRALWVFSAASGALTLLLGLVPTSWLALVVLLQALLSVCFFPAGYAAMARIVPPEQCGLIISLSTPLTVLIGAGGIPAGLGLLGDHGSFALGLEILGALTMLSALAVPGLQFQETRSAHDLCR